ncbi:MAG: hypothetical protein ACXVCP_08160 [Bdellovibrio sp.]
MMNRKYSVDLYKNSFFLNVLALFLLLTLFVPAGAEASVAFRSKSFVWNGNNTAETPPEPAGASQNDILFMWVLLNGNQTVTPPAGWTELYSNGGSVSIHLYWIRRGATAPNYGISWSTAVYNEVSVTAWSGAATSGNPYDVMAGNPITSRTPANPDCPAVMTTVANTVVIAFGMTWTGWGTTAGAPTGYMLAEGGISGSYNDLAVAYTAKASPGVEDPPAFSANLNNASGYVGEVTVALKPQLQQRVRHRVINTY